VGGSAGARGLVFLVAFLCPRSSLVIFGPLRVSARVSREPREPIAREVQAVTINLVAPHPSLPLVPEKPGRLEDLQVPRRRRPGLLEHTGYLAGGHRAALEIHREQDATTHGVGERREHCLIGIPLIAAFLLSHSYYLAQRLNIVKARDRSRSTMGTESKAVRTTREWKDNGRPAPFDG